MYMQQQMQQLYIDDYEGDVVIIKKFCGHDQLQQETLAIGS